MMYVELTNLWLFTLAILKLSVTTGFLFWLPTLLFAERIYTRRQLARESKPRRCRVIEFSKSNPNERRISRYEVDRTRSRRSRHVLDDGAAHLR